MFPIEPPVSPMLAKLARELPTSGGKAGDFLFEPKWDGFRAIVFRDGDEIEIGSRNEQPLTRYFPDLIDPLREQLPERCVVDGEIVIATDHGLDFDLLSLRIHPAASRVEMLAEETPASFVAFDLLAEGDDDLRALPFRDRRARLETGPGRRAVRRCCSRPRPPTGRWPTSGSSASRAPGSTASSPSRSTASTKRASGRCRR